MVSQQCPDRIPSQYVIKGLLRHHEERGLHGISDVNRFKMIWEERRKLAVSGLLES